MTTVALLDVDDTLYLVKKNEDGGHVIKDGKIVLELNQPLLNALEKRNIKDVYLFTDMLFMQAIVQERLDLVGELKKQGFNVLGVITPSDIVWETMKGLDDASIEMITSYKDSFAGKAFEDHLKTNPQVNELFGSYTPNLAKEIRPGNAFQEASTNREINYTAQSSFAKACADHLAYKNGYLHSKGLLLDWFLNSTDSTNSLTQIIIADDNDKVIETLRSFQRVDKQPFPPLTIIPVPRKDWDNIAYYNQILSADVIAVINKVCNHIEILKGRWLNPTKEHKNKIFALNFLITMLKDASDVSEKTIASVINTWKTQKKFTDRKTKEKVDVQTIVSTHSSGLFNSSSSSMTATFIETLISEYGDRSLIGITHKYTDTMANITASADLSQTSSSSSNMNFG